MREGIILEDKTAVSTSVETTCHQSQIQEQSSIELSPIHGFDADKDCFSSSKLTWILRVFYSISFMKSTLELWRQISKSGGGELLITHKILMS